MRSDGFVHLHLHTEYSLLDGACRIKPLMERVKELGQTAVAMTDHGNMYGAVEFWQAAKAAGLRPIIGCEVYVAPRTRFDKDPKLDGKPYHLILLCENNEGYSNLVKLVSAASIEGFYSKPRADLELLKKYHRGLICLSACLAGEIPRLLTAGKYSEARQKALEYREIFGEGNYYLEIQDHGIANEKKVKQQLYRLSAETGIPLAATNDCHYIKQTDSQLQEVLLCIQTGKRLGEPTGMSFETNEFYVKSADEMAELFSGHEEALENTVRISERCNVEFVFGQIKLPRFTMEEVTDNESFFRKLCTKGMYERYGQSPGEEVRQRLDYELSVITQMGYTDYFLIVWDFIRYAREHNVPVGPGRGSGAGSLCAYCIGITGIDPMHYGLLFERFLNPERVSMPDFDIDFCIEGRQSVKDYVVQKYGADRVSEIIAFDTLKARAAVKDVGRVLDVPYQLRDKASKLIDPRLTIEQAMEQSNELSQLCRTDANVNRMLTLAAQVEGMPRHTSVHAAGVVISAVPISDLVPLQRNDDTVVTQYTMGVLESLGLLKMDFLGLRNLTIIRDAVREIRRTEPDFDINSVPTDDQAVYDMLSAGDTEGVFQLESAGMTARLMELRPERLEDLIVMLSLYRPGPMKSIPVYIENKRHPEKVTYLHPLLEDILRDTYGVMVYQEQVMEICRKVAGYSYGHADIVRRAMAKKKHDVMLKERESFVAGAGANGVDSETADRIFDEMVSFASYAFNRSHAAAYAYLSYQTAYLKCRFRGIYMAALMSSVMGSTGKLTEYIGSCRENGIAIRPPDINRSQKSFHYENGGMYFALTAVKNVGEGLAGRIIAERRHGEYTGLQDFCERVEGRELNRKALENLIKAGAFDGMGLNRRQMLDNYELIMDHAAEDSRGVIDGQLNLLDAEAARNVGLRIPFRPEFDEKKLLAMEKEAAGVYLSGDPLSVYSYLSGLLRPQPISSAAGDEPLPDGAPVKLLCTLDSVKQHLTRRGDKMCFAELSDSSGTVDAVVFPELYSACASRLTQDAVLYVTGKVSQKEEGVSVICSAIAGEADFSQLTGSMRLVIKTQSSADHRLEELLKLCRNERGVTPVCLYFTDTHQTAKLRSDYCLRIGSESYRALCGLYGERNIGLV